MARTLPPLPDKVRLALYYSLGTLHSILILLALAALLGRNSSIIADMYNGTLLGIASNLAILVGDRGVKNWTAPQPRKDERREPVSDQPS